MAMSATIGNVKEIASWLGATPVISNFRPVPIKLGILIDNEIEYDDGTFETFNIPKKESIDKIIASKIKNGEQIMYVRQSRKNAEAFASRIIHEIGNAFFNKDLELPLVRTDDEIELNRCIKHGVAWHHAGLVQENRSYVEDNFKEGNIRLVCATTTLGAGINLPAKYVFLDWRRFSDSGLEPLSVGEALQILHRAGRPQYDDMGYGVLVCSKEHDYDYCMQNYFSSAPEPLHSPLLKTANTFYHSIIGNIGGKYATTDAEILEMYKNTLAFHQKPSEVRGMIDRTLKSFQKFEEPIVQKTGGTYSLTPIGTIIKRYYMNPDDAMIISVMLKNAKSLSPIGLVHGILRCRSFTLLRVKGDDQWWQETYMKAKETLFYKSFNINNDTEWRAFQTSCILIGCGIESEVIYADEETTLGNLCYHHGILAGDLQRTVGMQGNFSWLFAFSRAVANFYGNQALVDTIEEVDMRIRYGISAKLVKICNVRGIGRERGKALFKIGYCDVESISTASVTDIADVVVNDKKIGLKLGDAIIRSATDLLQSRSGGKLRR
jgi:helicase